jgi:hypothetical protein
MKRVLTGSCLAAAFAVGLAAQTPSPSTPPQTTPQTPPSAASPSSQDRDSAKAVTVTGCLKAGDSSDSFILSDLKWGGSKGSSTGAVGTSGSAPAAIGSATTLKIVPSGGAKLSEHVGHQVEISGTVGDSDKGSSRSAAPADPSAPRPSAPAGASASSAPTFEARTVKMVSQTCSM